MYHLWAVSLNKGEARLAAPSLSSSRRDEANAAGLESSSAAFMLLFLLRSVFYNRFECESAKKANFARPEDKSDV